MTTLQKLIESGLYKTGTPLKLHLGCGTNHFLGYINIDYPQEKHPVTTIAADAEADILNDFVFPDNSVDEIRLHHLFEHFSRVVALVQLVKWHSWLKVEGILVIETPDLLGSAQQLSSEHIDYKQKMAIVRHLEGGQSAPWGMHISQWWGERFETTLSKLGFHIIDIKYSQWERWPNLCSILVTATKLNDVELSVQIEHCLVLLRDSMVSDRELPTFNIWKDQLVGLLVMAMAADVLEG